MIREYKINQTLKTDTYEAYRLSEIDDRNTYKMVIEPVYLKVDQYFIYSLDEALTNIDVDSVIKIVSELIAKKTMDDYVYDCTDFVKNRYFNISYGITHSNFLIVPIINDEVLVESYFVHEAEAQVVASYYLEKIKGKKEDSFKYIMHIDLDNNNFLRNDSFSLYYDNKMRVPLAIDKNSGLRHKLLLEHAAELKAKKTYYGINVSLKEKGRRK